MREQTPRDDHFDEREARDRNPVAPEGREATIAKRDWEQHGRAHRRSGEHEEWHGDERSRRQRNPQGQSTLPGARVEGWIVSLDNRSVSHGSASSGHRVVPDAAVSLVDS